jgi:hypothetical protein
LLCDKFNYYIPRTLRFYIELIALCERSIYFIYYNLFIYYYVRTFIYVIPFPNKFNLLFFTLLLHLYDEFDKVDSMHEKATFVNSYVLDLILFNFFINYAVKFINFYLHL